MTTAAVVLDRLAPGKPDGPRSDIGRAWLTEHGLPDRGNEAWKYTPVDDVVAALLKARPGPDVGSSIDAGTIQRLAGDFGGHRMVYVNGIFAPHLSRTDGLADGLWLGGAEGLRPRRKEGATTTDEPADGFHALNWAAGHDVAAVLVDENTEHHEPIHVIHLTVPGDDPSSTHPRSVIRLAPNSSVQIIESFVGTSGSSVTNASTRVKVGDGARFTYRRIVDATSDAIHIGRIGINQAANSSVLATSVVTGGDIVRTALDVELAGEGASIDVDGLYVPTGRERHDNVVTVDHAASHCRSNQVFKGVAADHGRGSFSGHVIVRPGTVDTDAHQSNPNLVLSRTAQTDTRPWLEIFADDVRCTHGATVGRLDDTALFYLRSRGIPLEQARSVLVAAFAGEIVDHIEPDNLREFIAARVDAVIGAGGVIEENANHDVPAEDDEKVTQ